MNFFHHLSIFLIMQSFARFLFICSFLFTSSFILYLSINFLFSQSFLQFFIILMIFSLGFLSCFILSFIFWIHFLSQPLSLFLILSKDFYVFVVLSSIYQLLLLYSIYLWISFLSSIGSSSRFAILPHTPIYILFSFDFPIYSILSYIFPDNLNLIIVVIYLTFVGEILLLDSIFLIYLSLAIVGFENLFHSNDHTIVLRLTLLWTLSLSIISLIFFELYYLRYFFNSYYIFHWYRTFDYFILRFPLFETVFFCPTLDSLIPII